MNQNTFNYSKIIICVIVLALLSNSQTLFSQTLSNNLSWDANTEQNITGYRVYRSTNTGSYNPSNLLGSVTVGTTNYVDNTIQSDITYFYVVTAMNNQGQESTYSNEVTMKKTDPTYMPVLSNGSVSPTTGTNSTSFTYTVHYSDTGGSTPTTANVNIDGQTHTMTLSSGSQNNGDYTFTINTLEDGNHTFFFNFVDNSSNSVRLPTGTATISGPTVSTSKPAKPTNIRYTNK
jgi:fibronectin type 3 domain-containing protein